MVNRKPLLFLIYYMIITIALWLIVVLFKNDDNVLEIYCIISLLQLISSLVLIFKLGYSFLSLPIVFFVLSYVFHLGQLPLLVINAQVDMPWPVYDLMGEMTYIQCVEYVLKCHFYIALGIIIYEMFRKKTNYIQVDTDESFDLKKILTIGIVFCVIGIVPVIVYEIQMYKMVQIVGYGNTGLEKNTIMNIVTNMFYTGIILIQVGLKNSKKYSHNFFVCAIAFQCILMISGGRNEKVINIIMLIYVYFSLCRTSKINLKSVLKYGIVIYLGLTFITFLRYFRSINADGNFEISELFLEVLTNNIIFDVLAEFGGTLATLGYSFRFFTSDGVPLLGASYIKSLFMVFPNIGGFIESFRDEIMFVYQLPKQVQHALGGSYIAEMYMNFKDWISIFSILIGIGLGYISKKIEQLKNNKKWIRYVLFIVIYGQVIWWIRGYFSTIIRHVSWMAIILFVVNGLFNKEKNK